MRVGASDTSISYLVNCNPFEFPALKEDDVPRPPHADEAGVVYHVLNHGNARQPIFFKGADHEVFESLIAELGGPSE